MTRTDAAPPHLSRRGLLGLAGAGLTGLALAACGGGNGATTSATSTAATGAAGGPSTAPKKTVTITYWGSFSGNLGDAEKSVVDKFNASQSEVKVDYQFQGTYEETAQKLTAALSSGTQPDISLLSDVWWFKFYVAGALSPVDDLLTGLKVDASDFVPGLYGDGLRKGKHYWIPFARSTPLFYYNKDAFTAAGAAGRAPETWDEFVQLAPRLMKDGGVKTAFSHPAAGSYVAWVFQSVIRSFGGRYSDDQFNILLDQPLGIEAGNFYRSSVTDGWASTPQDNVADFTTGSSAATIASTGSLAGILKNSKFAVGTAFLPRKRDFNVCTGGAGFGILSKSSDEKRQAAAKFAAFASSPETTVYWSQQTGYMPVRTSAVQGQAMQDYFRQNPNFRTAVDQLQKATPQDAARVFIPNGDQIIGRGIDDILVNKRDAKGVFPTVAGTLRTEAKPVIDAVKKIEG